MHKVGHIDEMDTTKGTILLFCRPRESVRKKLFEFSENPKKKKEGLDKILSEITQNDYEITYRGRSNVDFSNDDNYKEYVGDFEKIIFPNPDEEGSDAYNYQLYIQWNNFFNGTKAKMENKDFDYAKDAKSFKRLFNHNSGIVVNTCHGIKGEEFQTVIAFGLITNYLLNWKESDLIKAGKKLLYVICSRAKLNLYLIAERGRTTRKGKPLGTPSLLTNIKYNYD